MSNSDNVNDSKNCIIQSAAALFAKLGLDKCSTREIAKKSDSNISLISYYFGGKEGLYKEVMRSHALKIKDEVKELVESFESKPVTREVFIQDFEKIVEHMVKSRAENPEVSKIFAREKLAGMPYSKEIHKEIFYPLIQNFFKLFKTGQANGFIKEDIHPALFFTSMSEAVWGFYAIADCETSMSHDFKPLVEDQHLLCKQIVSIFLTGVLK
jgi:AcrR family transcriptional regulator